MTVHDVKDLVEWKPKMLEARKIQCLESIATNLEVIATWIEIEGKAKRGR